MHDADIIIEAATQRLTDFLTAKKMRKTPERYVILRAACLLPGIFTIDQLDEQIRLRGEMQVSRTTRAAHYELNLQPTPKAYLVCSRCRKVAKLERKELETYLATVRSKSFVVQQPVLYLHGLCRKCYMEQIRKVKQTK